MSVLAILIAESPSAPMTPLSYVRAVRGRGLAGDRYFHHFGTFSPTPQKPDYELTLIEQEQIDAVEFHAVDFGLGGQVEHCVEVDERFGTRAALADEAGPHGVVKFRVVVLRHGEEGGWREGEGTG